MKERPIIFNAEMVRAIINGRKTQTRRVVKFDWCRSADELLHQASFDPAYKCPYGKVGDRLWVRETWDFQALRDGVFNIQDFIRWGGKVAYKADGGRVVEKWIPSIHMPRWASRITLEITSVRVERLQDISNDDCWAEGMSDATNPELKPNRRWFSELWESINGPGSWHSNPFVWVIEFRKETKP